MLPFFQIRNNVSITIGVVKAFLCLTAHITDVRYNFSVPISVLESVSGTCTIKLIWIIRSSVTRVGVVYISFIYYMCMLILIMLTRPYIWCSYKRVACNQSRSEHVGDYPSVFITPLRWHRNYFLVNTWLEVEALRDSSIFNKKIRHTVDLLLFNHL